MDKVGHSVLRFCPAPDSPAMALASGSHSCLRRQPPAEGTANGGAAGRGSADGSAEIGWEMKCRRGMFVQVQPRRRTAGVCTSPCGSARCRCTLSRTNSLWMSSSSKPQQLGKNPGADQRHSRACILDITSSLWRAFSSNCSNGVEDTAHAFLPGQPRGVKPHADQPRHNTNQTTGG